MRGLIIVVATGLIGMTFTGISVVAAGNEKALAPKPSVVSPGVSRSDTAKTFHLPPVAEFLPVEAAGDIFDIPYLSALCRLPMLIELLPPNMLEPVFASIVKDPPVAVTPAGCRDGVFRAESPPNFFGYRYIVTLAVKSGKIVSVDYDEVNASGKGKQGDKEYNKEMGKNGTNPAKAYPRYEQQLLKTQNILKVDAVSGATYSLYRFRTVAALALSEAKVKK